MRDRRFWCYIDDVSKQQRHNIPSTASAAESETASSAPTWAPRGNSAYLSDVSIGSTPTSAQIDATAKRTTDFGVSGVADSTSGLTQTQ